MPLFETSDSVNLYYEIHGHGEPIIFIHGLTANHLHFKYQVSGLAKEFQVIVYDQRGHGTSGLANHDLNLDRLARDLRELIVHLNLPRVSLVGWSLGAHVMFEYIKHYGTATLKRLCLIDMTPRLLKSENDKDADCWRHGLRGLNGRFGDFDYKDNVLTMAAMAASDWNRFAKASVERQYDRSLSTPNGFDYEANFKGKAEMAWLYEQALRNKTWVIVTLWASMSVQDYRHLLSMIDVPVLITYGEGSQYYDAENSRYMARNIKNATLASFPGCGHALHIQDHDAFNRLLRQFLTA